MLNSKCNYSSADGGYTQTVGQDIRTLPRVRSHTPANYDPTEFSNPLYGAVEQEEMKEGGAMEQEEIKEDLGAEVGEEEVALEGFNTDSFDDDDDAYDDIVY